MKKLLAGFIIVCLTLGLFLGSFGTIASARAETEGVWSYSVASGNATITGQHFQEEGAVVIPSTLGGYPVTSIGDQAFNSRTGLTSMTIPNSVTSIGEFAFYGCSGLTSVTIGNGVTTIGEYAFQYCTRLTSVTIGSGVTSISDWAFYNCTALTSFTVDVGNLVYSSDTNGVLFNKAMTLIIWYPAGRQRSYMIPSSVTNIGDEAFINCWGLTSFTVDEGNLVYSSSADGVLFDKTATSLVAYPGGKQGAYVIPNGVTRIVGRAFWGCIGLTNVTIPNSVTSIGSQAFEGCTALTGFTVDVGNSAYSSDAQGVLFNKAKTTIIRYPASKAGAYVIPTSVTTLDDVAFQGCSDLTSVTIPASVTSIGIYVFDACTKLTSVTIGSGVTGIGAYMFQGCTRLTSVTIPDSVTGIGTRAFSGCAGLISVSIGSGVFDTGDWAFEGCTKLSTAYFLGNAPTRAAGSFENCAEGFSVHYVTGTTGWSNPWCGYPTVAENNTTKNQAEIKGGQNQSEIKGGQNKHYLLLIIIFSIFLVIGLLALNFGKNKLKRSKH